MLENNGHDNLSGMVLKMDVEGCEWDVFDQLDENTLLRFDQIVIELHSLLTSSKSQKALILSVLEKLSNTHNVVHVHANNSCKCSYMENSVTPDVIEVTYIRKGYANIKKMTQKLPRNLDKASTIRLPEIKLGIWNY